MLSPSGEPGSAYAYICYDASPDREVNEGDGTFAGKEERAEQAREEERRQRERIKGKKGLSEGTGSVVCGAE